MHNVSNGDTKEVRLLTATGRVTGRPLALLIEHDIVAAAARGLSTGYR
jgi:hypothetical protein